MLMRSIASSNVRELRIPCMNQIIEEGGTP